jgi:hypothetical protein
MTAKQRSLQHISAHLVKSILSAQNARPTGSLTAEPWFDIIATTSQLPMDEGYHRVSYFRTFLIYWYIRFEIKANEHLPEKPGGMYSALALIGMRIC